jgi:hypothetical protein
MADGPLVRASWLANAQRGGVMCARGPGRRAPLRRVWGGFAEADGRKGLALEQSRKRPSSLICSVRRQRPGRRTSVCPDDGPRVREGHGGAGCHAGSPKCKGPRLREPSEPGKRGLQRMRWRPRGRFDCLQRRAMHREPRLRGSGFSQLKFSVTQVVLLPGTKNGGSGACCDRLVFVTDLVFVA